MLEILSIVFSLQDAKKEKKEKKTLVRITNLEAMYLFIYFFLKQYPLTLTQGL